MDERETARRAATSAFAMRVCGQTVKQNAYHGDFDYMPVVDAAQLPETGIKDHTMYWRRFWSAFDQAWREYAG